MKYDTYTDTGKYQIQRKQAGSSAKIYVQADFVYSG